MYSSIRASANILVAPSMAGNTAPSGMLAVPSHLGALLLPPPQLPYSCSPLDDLQHLALVTQLRRHLPTREARSGAELFDRVTGLLVHLDHEPVATYECVRPSCIDTDPPMQPLALT